MSNQTPKPKANSKGNHWDIQGADEGAPGALKHMSGLFRFSSVFECLIYCLEQHGQWGDQPHL